MDKRHVAITPDLFPYVFKDIDSSVFVAECRFPTVGSIDRVELVIDNNVLRALNSSPDMFKRLQWILGGAKGVIAHINPYFAIAEQYLSNPDNALAKLETFANHPGTLNTFGPTHVKDLFAQVKLHDSHVRSQLGVFVCYFFVLRSIHQNPGDFAARVSAWHGFFLEDIPRLAVPYLLGMLFFFSKEDPALKVCSTNRKVQEWASGFLAKRKEEVDDSARWIRNRLFDILPFILLPTLRWNKYGGMDSRQFILTQDRDVGECFLQLFFWIGENQEGERWTLARNMARLDSKRIDVLQEAIDQGPFSEEREQTKNQKKERLQRLVDTSIKRLSLVEQAELIKALSEFRFFDLLTATETDLDDTDEVP